MPIYRIFLILFLILSACQPTSQKEATAEQNEPTQAPVKQEEPAMDDYELIVFFGNSLTAGYQLDNPDEMAFPGLVQKKIRDLGLKYKIINAGVSGDTSADGLGRISFLLSQYPDISIFVLELGANDGLRGLPLAQTSENLQAIIDRVKTANPDVSIVIAGMEVPPNMGDDYASQFRNIFKDLAVLNQTALIPFLLDGPAGDPDLNLDDGIHPNEKGHKIVAENVWEVLKELL